MVQPLPLQPTALAAVNTDTQNAAVMRIGTVVRYDAGSIKVTISGSEVLVDAVYLFDEYRPALGDDVVVLKSGASWVVAGALSSNRVDNPVVNHSFEDDVDGAQPSGGWRRTHLTGAASTMEIEQMPLGREIDGVMALLQSFSIGSAEDVVESNSFAVQSSQVWTANAMMYAEAIAGGEIGPTVNLGFTWYADVNDAYASRLSETVIAQIIAPIGLPWLRLRPGGISGGALAPAGAQFARIQIFTSVGVATGLAFYVDRVIARRML